MDNNILYFLFFILLMYIYYLNHRIYCLNNTISNFKKTKEKFSNTCVNTSCSVILPYEYNQGLNNFDVIYYINLKHRVDRFDHINNELSKTNIDKNKINRIEGIYIKDFGILGCAKSHILALQQFIKSPHNTCIIFEDDFEFTQDQIIINNLINRFFNEVKDFDVLMLSANILNNQPTNYDFITKIIDAQTLSGYAINKKFAEKLLNNYQTSVYLLEQEGHKVHDLCFDIYIKKLQPNNNWFCLNPIIGKQLESYSDIENKIVYYDC